MPRISLKKGSYMKKSIMFLTISLLTLHNNIKPETNPCYQPTEYQESKLYEVLKTYSNLIRLPMSGDGLLDMPESYDLAPGLTTLLLTSSPIGTIIGSSLFGLGMLSYYAEIAITQHKKAIKKAEEELISLLHKPDQIERINQLKSKIQQHKEKLKGHSYLITELKKEGITPELIKENQNLAPSSLAE